MRHGGGREIAGRALPGLDRSDRRARQEDHDSQALAAHDDRLDPLGVHPFRQNRRAQVGGGIRAKSFDRGVCIHPHCGKRSAGARIYRGQAPLVIVEQATSIRGPGPVPQSPLK